MRDLDLVLSDEGWPYASATSVEPGDPGRYHALFGRDSLITALQLLPERPDIARATCLALARRQGTRVDDGTQEAPGKIGHEFRPAPPESFVEAGWPEGGAFAYYGSADATSWFCVVVEAAGLGDELADAWRAAGDWIAAELDRGGGLLRHEPGSFPGGLTNQGWRDAIDPTAEGGHGGGLLRPDGRALTPPVADIDTQAVTHAALRALARLSGSDAWSSRAADLRSRLSALPPDALAVDADGPVRGAGSQLGWLLWADALEPAAAEAVATRVCAPDVLTDFGLRTLSSESPVFDPHGYHRGSVWPFDSWLGWGGLRAAGRTAEAERVRTGVLRALDILGRAPELYAVTLDGEIEPVAVSNLVQAWTIGARSALEREWDGRSPNPTRGVHGDL
jgi:glycogen debranching enzyme